ncbi:MAG TPA: hypothetical protein PLF48_07975 [Chitinophagales bacterium]|nr:hypothetical protein [Chitinophagales bacterium]
MELLNNENVILESGNNSNLKVILTDLRIMIYTNLSFIGNNNTKEYVFHEDVSKIETSYVSKKIYLIIAGILVLFGISMFRYMFLNIYRLIILIFLVSLFIFFYFFSRAHYLNIYTNGSTKLGFSIVNKSDQEVSEIIKLFQQAKFNRVTNLRGNNSKTVTAQVVNLNSNKEYCRFCNNKIKENDIYCENCGNKII